ncbi:MAG: HNH endonuclease [Bacteroidales bacterium]
MNDTQIRLEVFNWLQKQIGIYNEVLPWEVLSYGFKYNNERVPLIGPQGIWKPQILMNYPLSITTSPNSPYDDKFSDDGHFLSYKYRGTNPNHRDNIMMKHAMQNQIPLIYFIGLRKGWYFTVFPVYILGDNEKDLTFKIAAEDSKQINFKISDEFDSNIEESLGLYKKREYITVQVRQRLHQRSFRERVLMAYRVQCALCRIKHTELLDAAHILPDKDPLGEPIISNGISLCKIHHAAYDSNILGITPDYIVDIRKDILKEHDGHMLKHGLIDLHGKPLILPHKEIYKPNRDYLDQRYKLFKNAS